MQRRSDTQPPISARERISDFENFGRHLDQALGTLWQLAGKDEPVDMQDIYLRYTMDTACGFLFGVPDLNTLGMPLPKAGRARLGSKGSASESIYGGFAEAVEQVQVTVQM